MNSITDFDFLIFFYQLIFQLSVYFCGEFSEFYYFSQTAMFYRRKVIGKMYYMCQRNYSKPH